MTLSMTAWRNRTIPESPTRSLTMGFSRKPTIAPLRIVSILNRALCFAFLSLIASSFPILATRPSCPKAMMQFQHGKYSVESNGSLVLTPFADDGRQLISDPCKSLMSRYYRYNQTEVFRVSPIQFFRILSSRCSADIPCFNSAMRSRLIVFTMWRDSICMNSMGHPWIPCFSCMSHLKCSRPGFSIQ